MTFKDHFSGHASLYAQNRPRYDQRVAEALAELAPARTLAWDVGTGNGQLAVELAPFFDHIIATDPSAPQIEKAVRHDKIEYRVEPGEQSTLADHTAALITVAQAAHWLDAERFAPEVRRVALPGAAIIYTAYDLLHCDEGVDEVLRWFYRDVVGSYWPPERAHFDSGYRSVPFPFDEITPPALELHDSWTRARLLAYVETWSSVQRYRKQTGTDPLTLLTPRLAAAWPDGDAERALVWPLLMRAGYVR